MHHSKRTYPYLKATLDALIEAAPNWTKAPAKFFSSLSEQLKDKPKEEIKQLEQEIKGISKDELEGIIKDAGCKERESIELIVEAVGVIPDFCQKMDYRFGRVDGKLDEIKDLLKLKPEKSLQFPLPPSLHNQTPPEENFVGRTEMLATITEWYKNPEVRIGALIGWGGVGKSALIRKWHDLLAGNNIQPDGIFWWGFYGEKHANLELFLNALLKYVSRGEIDPETIKSTWEKTERIKEYLHQGTCLIILDGLEQMQKGESGNELGRMEHPEFVELLHYLADASALGLCLITTRYPLKDLDEWAESSYQTLSLVDLSIPDSLAMLKRREVKGNDEDMEDVVKRYKGHALSLTSLAGFLNRYYDGDIKKAPEIEFVLSDEERFKDVNKLLHRYAEKMSDAELCFLKIFSLFRREITEKEFAGVFQHKMEFNDALVKMNELDFKDLVNGLVDWRLISEGEREKEGRKG
ncbi:hypothetical protein KKC52_01230, partial [bacterium]|nr:hypothetical protein [bacterium]